MYAVKGFSRIYHFVTESEGKYRTTCGLEVASFITEGNPRGLAVILHLIREVAKDRTLCKHCKRLARKS